MKNILLIIAIVAFSACTKTEYKLMPPQLEVIVSDINGEETSGVKVSLYGSQSNWESGLNKITSGSTNSSGSITFKELDEEIYFISAESGSQNNQKDVVSFEEPLKAGEKRIIKTLIQ